MGSLTPQHHAVQPSECYPKSLHTITWLYARHVLPLVLPLSIYLPFTTGRILFQWVMIPMSDCKSIFLIVLGKFPSYLPSRHSSRQAVQKRFTAYIVDLVHVLEKANEKKLTRRVIKRAFTVYHDLQTKTIAHGRIREFDFSNTRIQLSHPQ